MLDDIHPTHRNNIPDLQMKSQYNINTKKQKRMIEISILTVEPELDGMIDWGPFSKIHIS